MSFKTVRVSQQTTVWLGGPEERRQGAIVQRMRESVADQRVNDWVQWFVQLGEHREGRGRGGHNRVPQSPHKARRAAQKQISGFVFVTLTNISSPLLYTCERNHKEAKRRLSKQKHKMF